MVAESRRLSVEASAVHTADVNCGPLLEVITAGTQNLDTQWCTKAWAHAEAVVETMGMASGQRVVLSTMVKMLVNPPEEGRGPTRSMCMWENLRWGIDICSGVE